MAAIVNCPWAGRFVDAVHFQIEQLADAQTARSLEKQGVGGQPGVGPGELPGQGLVRVRGKISGQGGAAVGECRNGTSAPRAKGVMVTAD